MKRTFTLLLLLATTLESFGQWTASTVIPANRVQHGAVAHPNGNVYLFSGYPGSGPEVGLMHIFNTTTNTWSSGPSVPFVSRGVAYCLGTDNNIYCLGGFPVTNSFAAFNPSTNTWTTLTNCPTGAWEGAMTSFNNKIYYSGGETNESLMRIYDMATGVWSSGAALPTGVMQHKMVSGNNGKLYVFGGRNSSTSPVNAVQAYDIATNTWATIGTIPVQKNQFGACLAPDGQIYLICGKNNYGNNSGPFFSDVNIFNPCTNSWSTGPAHPTAHGELAATSTTAGIFAMGGTSGSGLNINYFLPVSGPSLSYPNITTSPSSGQACINTTYTITASGANTFTWSTGVTTIISSSLVITPTANISYSVAGTSTSGCASAVPTIVSFTVNPSPVITANSGTICEGSSFTITPSGALTYTYSGGSDIISPNVTTAYTVTGSDANGCVGNAVSNVAVNAAPVITVNSGSICAGESFTITPNGAGTYTFSGGPVVNPAVTTSYSVSGTSSLGCISLAPGVSSVVVFALPSVSVSTSSSGMCSGETAVLTASGANSFQWLGGQQTATISITPSVTTSYTVTGTGNGGCTDETTFTQLVNACTGISEQPKGHSFRLYPNPGNGQFVIEFSQDASLNVFDISGKLMASQNIHEGSNQLSMELTSGIYFFTIIDGNAVLGTGKLIVQH